MVYGRYVIDMSIHGGLYGFKNPWVWYESRFPVLTPWRLGDPPFWETPQIGQVSNLSRYGLKPSQHFGRSQEMVSKDWGCLRTTESIGCQSLTHQILLWKIFGICPCWLLNHLSLNVHQLGCVFCPKSSEICKEVSMGKTAKWCALPIWESNQPGVHRARLGIHSSRLSCSVAKKKSHRDPRSTSTLPFWNRQSHVSWYSNSSFWKRWFKPVPFFTAIFCNENDSNQRIWEYGDAQPYLCRWGHCSILGYNFTTE